MRAKLENQIMSPLPAVRIGPSRPFVHVGIDFAGPMAIRHVSGRGYKSFKAYISVFVCFTTKALHLELVTSYRTDSFLAAQRRFIARRGLPNSIYLDNGTNFKGADAELQRSFKSALKHCDVQNAFSHEALNWHFIPPAAPHQGGLWERAVQSVKHHLKRQMGSFTPTWEEILTILTQIEACLNSRPLTPLYDDPNDEPALTPGHFLIGSSFRTIPEPSRLDLKDSHLTRWNLSQKLVESFWDRYRKDYLAILHSRNKWQFRQTPVKVNDIVLLRDPVRPPCDWGLARVIEVTTSRDGEVREVLLKIGKTQLRRPITQLCKLPVNENDEST